MIKRRLPAMVLGLCMAALTACGASGGTPGDGGGSGTAGGSDLKTMLKRAQDCAEVAKIVEAVYEVPDGSEMTPTDSESKVGCTAYWQSSDDNGYNVTASLTLSMAKKHTVGQADLPVKIKPFACWHTGMTNPVLECYTPSNENVFVSLSSGHGLQYIEEERQAFASELEKIMKEYAAYLTS